MTDAVDPTHNPWTTKTVETRYDNPWIRVEHHDVITPGGNPGIYGKVCMKNLAIGIIPIDNEGCTWLVGQYRYTINEYSWEIPMGGVPHGEGALEGAKRELLEETGISANRWTNLMRVHTSNCITDEAGYIFLAEDLSFGQSEPEDTEELLIKRVPLIAAIQMAMDSEITDTMAVAGLLKVAMLKGITGLSAKPLDLTKDAQ